MTAPKKARRREDASLLACIIAPLAVGVILNAVVRPMLAQSLNGERHSSGAGVRSRDIWWTFPPETASDHPILTAFLAVSDGQIGLVLLATVGLLLLIRWVIRRRRTAGNR